MTTNAELRAAAARQMKWASMTHADYLLEEHDDPDGLQRIVDAEATADHILATVNTDDDEPVTGQQCLDAGLKMRKTHLGSVYYSTDGTLLAWHPAKDQWFLNGGSVSIKVSTVGQLRSLLTGLGIKLKGGA